MAYYALLKLHIMPHEILAMDEQEKAFTVAAIQVKMANDKKNEKKLKQVKGRRKGR